MSGEGRPGRPDDAVDRQYRGKDCGAGLGLCLGVAANGPAFGPEGARLSASERTEAALDLREHDILWLPVKGLEADLQIVM